MPRFTTPKPTDPEPEPQPAYATIQPAEKPDSETSLASEIGAVAHDLAEQIGEVFDGAGFVTSSPEESTEQDDDAPHPGTEACPHCGATEPTYAPHDGSNPFTAGARHCNACGGCWVWRGRAWVIREGHSVPTTDPVPS